MLMSDIECQSCGQQFSSEIAPKILDGVLRCPNCGAGLEISRHAATGAETVIHPELLRGPEMSDDSPTDLGAETTPVTAQTTAIDPVEPDTSNAAPGDPEPAAPILKGYLLRTGTIEPGPTIPLAGARTVVGRVGANITVDDPTVSAHHFEITTRDDEFFIRDLNSTHGTFLNGARISSAQIKSHDSIRAGESEFLFTTMGVIPLR